MNGGEPLEIWSDPANGHRLLRQDLVIDRGVSFESASERFVGSAPLPRWERAPFVLFSNRSCFPLSLTLATCHSLAAEVAPDSKSRDGFWASTRQQFGRNAVLLALSRPGQRGLFDVTRPNTGRSFFQIDENELEEKGALVPKTFFFCFPLWIS